MKAFNLLVIFFVSACNFATATEWIENNEKNTSERNGEHSSLRLNPNDHTTLKWKNHPHQGSKDGKNKETNMDLMLASEKLIFEPSIVKGPVSFCFKKCKNMETHLNTMTKRAFTSPNTKNMYQQILRKKTWTYSQERTLAQSQFHCECIVRLKKELPMLYQDFFAAFSLLLRQFLKLVNIHHTFQQLHFIDFRELDTFPPFNHSMTNVIQVRSTFFNSIWNAKNKLLQFNFTQQRQPISYLEKMQSEFYKLNTSKTSLLLIQFQTFLDQLETLPKFFLKQVQLYLSRNHLFQLPSLNFKTKLHSNLYKDQVIKKAESIIQTMHSHLETLKSQFKLETKMMIKIEALLNATNQK